MGWLIPARIPTGYSSTFPRSIEAGWNLKYSFFLERSWTARSRMPIWSHIRQLLYDSPRRTRNKCREQKAIVSSELGRYTDLWLPDLSVVRWYLFVLSIRVIFRYCAFPSRATIGNRSVLKITIYKIAEAGCFYRTALHFCEGGSVHTICAPNRSRRVQ